MGLTFFTFTHTQMYTHTRGSCFSPCTMWVPGMELMWSGSAASTFTWSAPSQALTFQLLTFRFSGSRRQEKKGNGDLGEQGPLNLREREWASFCSLFIIFFSIRYSQMPHVRRTLTLSVPLFLGTVHVVCVREHASSPNQDRLGSPEVLRRAERKGGTDRTEWQRRCCLSRAWDSI